MQPRSNLPWKKDAPPVAAAAPRLGRSVDVKRVALAAGVLAILAAFAVWAIAITFRPGPVQRLAEVPVDAAPYPLAPAATSDAKHHGAPAPRPKANTSSHKQDTQAPIGTVLPPQLPPGSGQSLAPTASSPARSAAAPRAVPLPPPELRFETFEQVRDQAIYSARDADVRPPVPVYPKQLGRIPLGARREDLAMIEILVNADGTVAAVKAQDSPQSLDDALVITTSLSAAKSWLFQPAQREGRPVRYRHVLPVSLR